ncbi:cytochrome c oxidase subunit mitochondrial-like protein [Labeo rohita]|uniref:Cytochrome c oxidase subunit 8B, mitochondrial n=2 Tax=Labeo rohita TaxID=84645 RepID=A0ABQ8LKQ9_LABRO|nr:cytochrome c oxidase subunit 8B, mitochondrial [Labeo rohita]KAI2651265.1 Cytochrome c oxidase subunit 8B, mitochondrial [Labeo rohita]RXN07316.1 cytochrome c oxidase subunit mitochondrial-like protein [Labeo rohita]
MSGLLRGIARIRTAPALRGSTITQRANIATRPAKDLIGPAETTIGLAIFSITILGPSGWVLANLESYKNKGVAQSE